MTNEVPKTHQDLREMVYHTDARVTALEGRVSTVIDNQVRQESKLDHLIAALGKPKDINWIGLGALALSFLVALAGGAKFMTEYVALTMAPVNTAIIENSTLIVKLREFQHQTHYEFGGLHERGKQWDDEIARLWDHIHKQEDVDRTQDAAIAEAKVSRKAMGDYIRQIDELGSRRWMQDSSTRASRVE